MQILSQATDRYLRPQTNLGDAIMFLDLHHTPKEEENNENNVKQFLVEVYDKDVENNKSSPYSVSASLFVNRRFQHGHRRLSKKGVYHPRFLVPATDYSLYLFLRGWTGKREITESAREHLNKMIARENSFSSSAQRSARYKDLLQKYVYEEKFPEDLVTELELNPFLDKKGKWNPNVPEPTLYQKVMASNGIANDGYAFFAEPGCGKTYPAIQTIDFVSALANSTRNRPGQVLILMPKNIRNNWAREIKRFSKFNSHVSILQGPNEAARNLRLIESLVGPQYKTHVVIAGYEAAVGTPLCKKIEWDLVILDESHCIANFSTKRAKFCLQLRDSAAKRLVLSGTPIRNTAFDLYTQFEFMGKGYSGFPSFNAFKEFFGVWKDIPGKGIRILEQMQNIPLLQERLAKMCFLIKKEEAMPALPKKVYDRLECSLSKEQYQVYTQIATQLQAEIDSVEIKDEVTIRSHLTKMLRLAEVTSGYAKTDESGIYRFDPNNKLEMLVEEIKEYLDNNPKSKIQIWAHWTENIKQISYRLQQIEKIQCAVFYGGTKDSDRQIAEDEFNTNPECRVFIGSPSAGGVGLNLLGYDKTKPDESQTNCDWVIYYSQNFSTVVRRQSEDRAHRKGTRTNVRITDLIVPGSIDEMIIERVKDKIEAAMTLQDIKSILANALKPAVNGD